MIKTPVCILTVDNKPLNDVIQSRIISVTVTDNRADEADQLDITLDDSDGKLELPRRGVKINCILGWKDAGTYDKGDFIVDGVEWSGTPDTINIKASSANFKSAAKSANSKSFHNNTLGEIANNIANNNNLKLNITADLASIEIQHIDQTNESDLNFLKRLAKANGAEMAIKKDQVLIFAAGSGLTASGKSLSAISISKADGDQYRYNEEDRDSDYTGVSATYNDTDKAKKEKTTTGSDGKVKTLKGTFSNKSDADRAAAAEMQKIKRQMAKFSFTTAFGIPQISTESPVNLVGFKSNIDALKWIVAKATHSYSTSGLTTQLELEAEV